MGWARSELEHVGRIVSMSDSNLQYAYALSTVNGMAHLKDALFQMVNDSNYKIQKHELLTTHEKVIRAMKHLVKDFNLDLGTIEAFNTRHTLSNLSYLKNSTRSNKNKINTIRTNIRTIKNNKNIHTTIKNNNTRRNRH
jgi:hypothetical protein